MGDLVKVMGWREGEGRRKERRRRGERRRGVVVVVVVVSCLLVCVWFWRIRGDDCRSGTAQFSFGFSKWIRRQPSPFSSQRQ